MNIFENAKFGDKFLTKDNRIALYVSQVTYFHTLIVKGQVCFMDYDCSGSLMYPDIPELKIVGRWEEAIDEEEIEAKEH